jgi:hypothetical protein
MGAHKPYVCGTLGSCDKAHGIEYEGAKYDGTSTNLLVKWNEKETAEPVAKLG